MPAPLLPGLTLLLLLLAGCGATPTAEALRGVLGGGEEDAGSPVWSAEAEAASQPSAAGPALALAIGDRHLVATLVQANGDRRLWRSERGRVALATDGPRVVATAGLRQQVMATRLDGPDPLLEDPLALLAGGGEGTTTRRLVDLSRADGEPSGMRFGLAIECRLRAGREGATAATAAPVLVEERCRGAGGIGGFVNRFWADPATGAVVRSEQWIGDEMPPLALEPLGPA